MSDNAPPSRPTTPMSKKQAEQALSTVDSEFGRTTDPVRMYMREMGSVELLTREGEIEIAKRIEDGLKHTIQAISGLPDDDCRIVDCADKIERDEMRIDELIDGLDRPNATKKRSRNSPKTRRPKSRATRKATTAKQSKGAAAARRCSSSRKKASCAWKSSRRFTKKGARPRQEGSQDKTYPQSCRRKSRRDDGHPLHVQDHRAPVRVGTRMVEEVRACERKIQRICVDTVRMPRPHFIGRYSRQRTQPRLGRRRTRAAQQQGLRRS